MDRERIEFAKAARMALILVIVLAMALCMTGCRKKGLAAAYEKFARDKEKAEKEAKDGEDPSAAPLTNIQYNEKFDRMYITLDEKTDDVDEFFDALEKFVEDEDIGEIILNKPYNEGESHDEYMKKIGERLGKLSCKSLKMLGMSVSLTDVGDAWTEILGKTDKLYVDENSGLMYIEGYSQEALGRLAAVKKLAYHNTGGFYYYLFHNFSGIEELTISAGLTESDWNEVNEQNTDMGVGETYASQIKEYKNLKKLLIYPEATGWKPSVSYYKEALAHKRVIPEVETNIPGSNVAPETQPEEGEDGTAEDEKPAEGDEPAGDEKEDKEGEEKAPEVVQEIVKFKDYKVLATASDNEKSVIMKDVLKTDAEKCYKKGKKFKKKSGKPKLYGKCLVYHGEPHDDQFDKDKFYDLTSQILYKNELDIKKIQLPEDIDDYRMFIYIYPKHKYYGRYDKGTKGYSTQTMVAVYDMKKKIRYEAKQVKSENPPQSFSYYGSAPDKHYPDCDIKAARKYIKSLPYKAKKEKKKDESSGTEI